VTKEIIKKSVEGRAEFFDENKYDFHHKHSHSLYLSIIAERGIFGASVFFIFILMWLKALLDSLHLARSSELAFCLWSGSLSAFLATFIIGFVNTTFHHEHGILACFFLGLHLAYIKIFSSQH
jgi:O-antigen ligase